MIESYMQIQVIGYKHSFGFCQVLGNGGSTKSNLPEEKLYCKVFLLQAQCTGSLLSPLLRSFLSWILCVQELEALRGGEATRLRELSAEQRELRSELEAVHSEQARRLGQARQEQLELESRLEQLRQQACACEPGAQQQQEAQYTAQVGALNASPVLNKSH